jgi:hypothetical protein
MSKAQYRWARLAEYVASIPVPQAQRFLEYHHFCQTWTTITRFVASRLVHHGTEPNRKTAAARDTHQRSFSEAGAEEPGRQRGSTVATGRHESKTAGLSRPGHTDLRLFHP